MASEQEQAAIRSILNRTELCAPIIVELGAHCGEDYRWIQELCHTPPHYVMVEPDPRNVQYLIDDAQFRPRARIIIGAVSDHSGFEPFHFCENSVANNHASGSLRAPTEHLECFPEVTFPNVGMVHVYSLDAIFEREWLTKIDLLWADVQGAENLMIAGGANALSHTRYLFMEAEPAVALYEGVALRKELLGMLPGWTLLGEFEANVLMRNDNFTEREPR